MTSQGTDSDIRNKIIKALDGRDKAASEVLEYDSIYEVPARFLEIAINDIVKLIQDERRKAAIEELEAIIRIEHIGEGLRPDGLGTIDHAEERIADLSQEG